MRRLLTLPLLVFVLSCKERVGPPGSGALETTPTSTTSIGQPTAVSPNGHRSYPNGAVAVLEPTACRLQAIASGKQLWTRNYPACAGLLEVAIARDSTAFIRSGRELAAVDNQGRERWRIKLEGGEIPLAIASPATLADSRVVIAESPRTVAVIDADGRPAWRFSVPTEEMLVAPPEGLATEGVALLTGVASYVLGADGELRSRVTTGK